jgi:16S rRNA (guanine(527)-N(7))-methyltransferase RsmG
LSERHLWFFHQYGILKKKSLFIDGYGMISADSTLWQLFAERHSLSTRQLEQYQHFYALVQAANEDFNVTAIATLAGFIGHHFDDSLILGSCIDLSTITMLVDVGTGAGFPGIALKILYPALPMVLIEVTHKKIHFLKRVITELGLVSIEIYGLDWRTFLRTTQYSADLFCSRASLHPAELIRMFKPSCSYRHAQLVYWASRTWQPEDKEVPYVQREYAYKVNSKERKLIFFAASS